MNTGYEENLYTLGTIGDKPLTVESIKETNAQMLAHGLSTILPWSEIALAEENLLAHFTRTDPALFRFAIRYDDEIVGAISIRAPWLKGPYLELFGLLPAVHRMGLGTVIMEWFETQAPETSRCLWLLCSDFNSSAYKFYLANGYNKVCIIDNLFDESFNDILMRKRIM